MLVLCKVTRLAEPELIEFVCNKNNKKQRQALT